MRKLKIESSMITAVGYDVASKRLCVEFTGGAVYDYKTVPGDVVLAMLMAESHGRYFNEYIRDTYKYKEKKKWPTA